MTLNVDNPDAADADPRLAALRATALLDSPPEVAFDEITKLVSAALRVPVALVSFVDRDRQFFKSQCGLPEPWASARQTPLTHSFCQHVASRGEPLIVGDARIDPLVRHNLAVPDLGVIAYAGVPLMTDEGLTLGSLCAIDVVPRTWTTSDVEVLWALAAQVMLEIRLRARADALAERLEDQRGLAESRRAMTRLTVHDLRTPLSALLMGVELLPRLGPVSPQQASALAICKRNGAALLGLLDDLLDVGAADSDGGLALQQRELHARDVADQAAEQVRALAIDGSIGLNVDVAATTLPRVFADEDKLVRVLVNLLGNAVKFTRSGGRVTLDAAEVTEGHRAFVRFSVRDTGIGIAPGARLFDEGVRLDTLATTRRSAGLGLTFCKRIVEAHGGRIGYDSEPGVGSTFHFTVPVVR